MVSLLRKAWVFLLGLLMAALAGSCTRPRLEAARSSLPDSARTSGADDDFRLASNVTQPTDAPTNAVAGDPKDAESIVSIVVKGPARHLVFSFEYEPRQASGPPLISSLLVKKLESKHDLFICEMGASATTTPTLPNPWLYAQPALVDSSIQRCEPLTAGEYEVYVEAVQGRGHLRLHVSADGIVSTRPWEGTPESVRRATDDQARAKAKADREREERRWREMEAIPDNARSTHVGRVVLQLEGCRLAITDFETNRRYIETSLSGPCSFAVDGNGKAQIVDTADGPNLLVISSRRRPGNDVCDTRLRAVAVRLGSVHLARKTKRSSHCLSGPIDAAWFAM